MTHPTTARGGWAVEHVVYDDKFAGIAVAIMRHEERIGMAIRWLPNRESPDKGCAIGSWMDGETDWFILPLDFAVAVGRTLIERKAAGLDRFNDAGFKAMVEWLLDQEGISGTLCY